MKHTLNYTMRKIKKIKTGSKGKNLVLAAAWVDKELRDNIKLRSCYSREWNKAKRNNSQPELIEICKRKYLKQKHITTIMSGNKKSQWEDKKIKETWNNGKKIGK